MCPACSGPCRPRVAQFLTGSVGCSGPRLPQGILMEGCEFQVAEALLASCAELSSKTASDCACSSGGRGGGVGKSAQHAGQNEEKRWLKASCSGTWDTHVRAGWQLLGEGGSLHRSAPVGGGGLHWQGSHFAEEGWNAVSWPIRFLHYLSAS